VSQDEVKRTGETGVEETILEGHIGITKELLAFQTSEKKYYIGCEKGGANLIKVWWHPFCIEFNLFTYSSTLVGPSTTFDLAHQKLLE
jgi:hypothetical protein